MLSMPGLTLSQKPDFRSGNGVFPARASRRFVGLEDRTRALMKVSAGRIVGTMDDRRGAQCEDEVEAVRSRTQGAERNWKRDCGRK